jgi:4-hydroxybenzoate polyprenyltransferase
VTGNDLGLTIRSAAIDAAASWRTLVALGHPRDWAWTAVPFLVGAWDVARGLEPGIVVGLLFLLGPFWLTRRGMEAIIDGGSGLAPATVWFAVGVATIPLLLILAVLAGPLAALVLALLTGLAVADAMPPARTRDRPAADLATIGAAALLLAMSGPLVAGHSLDRLPWPVLLAFAAWSVGIAALDRVARLPQRPDGRQPWTGTVDRLGPRLTGWLALGAIALAVLLALLAGGLGALAAIGVACYLLLPAMLVSRPGPATTTIAAARDAIVERRGLDLLVGAWLAVLLAWHWGLATWEAWTVVIVVPAVLTSAALVNLLTTRLVTRRRGTWTRGAVLPPPKSLVIIVPTHDDAERLPACLAAISAQTYADTSVLVVDTGSSDGSREEALAWFEDVVLDAPPPPPGWETRDWARHAGVADTDAELILFVAPDTILAPVATRLLVERLETHRLDLLSGIPRDLMPTLGERAGVPGFGLALFGLVPLWFPALTGGRPSATAFADGGLLLVRRSAYDAVVGDAPLGRGGGRWLARRFVDAGYRVGLIHVARLAGRRRVPSLAGALATWRRRTAEHGRARLAGAIAVLLVMALGFGLPVLLPALALVADVPPAVLTASAVPLGLLILVRLALALTQHQPILSILWHPVTIIVALAGQAGGIWDRVRGTVEPPDDDDLVAPGPPLDDPFSDLPDPTVDPAVYRRVTG